jgi:hypothetical protein
MAMMRWLFHPVDNATVHANERLMFVFHPEVPTTHAAMIPT